MLQFPRKLLFGDDKLAFLSSPTGIPRLWKERHIPTPPEENAHLYWASFTTVFDTPSDVFSLLSVSDLRRALDMAPENITSLVRLVAAHLESLVDDPAFCPQPSTQGRTGGGVNLLGWIGSSAGAGAASSTSAAQKDGRDRTREALNCVRILTRVLPVVMEGGAPATSASTSASNASPLPYDPKHYSALEYELLWKPSSSAPALAPDSLSEPSKPPLTTSDSDNQFVIDDGDDEDLATPADPISDPLQQPSQPSTTAPPQTDASSTAQDANTESCFMEQLLEVCINLLFRSGFTIPWTDDQQKADQGSSSEPSFVHLVIWYAGVGASQELEGTTRAHESHRAEVLRLLLVLLSKSMYIPIAEQRTVPNHLASYAVSKLDRTVVLPLLCSLLNTVSHCTNPDSAAGWLSGISNNRLLGGSNEDVRATLTALSLQTLNVLIGYEHARGNLPSSSPGPTSRLSPGSGSTNRPTLSPFQSTGSVPSASSSTSSIRTGGTDLNGTASQQKNAFRFYLSKLHRAQDFQNIWTSLSAILNAPLTAASSTFLPLVVGPNALVGAAGGGLSSHAAATAAGVYVPEAMMLLWRMLLHNPKFRTFLLEDDASGHLSSSASGAPGAGNTTNGKKSLVLLNLLLFHALSGKDQVQRHGLVRLCVFMLQDVSSDKSFGLQISKPGTGSLVKLPSRFGIVGTTAGNGSGADVLIQAVYSLIATTKGSLSSLYPPLVISLTNTSPYWRNLTVTSATRLSQLLRSFSSPAYLFADEGNPRNLYYLLEALSFVLQYHFANNANVAYALVRSGSVVDGLATFTLRRGIAQIRKRRARAGLAPSGAAAAPATAAAGVPGGGVPETPSGTIMSPPLPSDASPEQKMLGGGTAPASSDPAQNSTATTTDTEKARLAQREADLEAATQHSLSLRSAASAGTDPATMTPTTPAAPMAGSGGEDGRTESATLSEKARGKLRQSSLSMAHEGGELGGGDGLVGGVGDGIPGTPRGRRSVSGGASVGAGATGGDDEEVDELIFSLTEEELYEAARTVGRHGFVPTQEWVTSWQKGLPLDTIQLALTELKPRVEALCASETVANRTDADERVLAFLREQTLAGVLPPAPPIVTRPFRWTDQSQVWLTSYLWGSIYAFAVLPHAIWRDTEVRLFQILEPPSGSSSSSSGLSSNAAAPAAGRP
ncbi:hypothetical protein OC861_002411 [Tilletia horrida]|nr:hypothetical protein OC861_002411 [Tilletia horrida]